MTQTYIASSQASLEDALLSPYLDCQHIHCTFARPDTLPDLFISKWMRKNDFTRITFTAGQAITRTPTCPDPCPSPC